MSTNIFLCPQIYFYVHKYIFGTQIYFYVHKYIFSTQIYFYVHKYIFMSTNIFLCPQIFFLAHKYFFSPQIYVLAHKYFDIQHIYFHIQYCNAWHAIRWGRKSLLVYMYYFLISCGCLYSVFLPHDVVGWSAVWLLHFLVILAYRYPDQKKKKRIEWY